MFFSVDVETSSLSPFNGGSLLTIGVVPVDEEGNLLDDDFYARIRCNLPEYWYGGQQVVGDETFNWWLEQNREAQLEAWADLTLERNPLFEVAGDLYQYLIDIEPDYNKRFFVANPVSFDFMWVTQMFATVGIEGAFHYRSLCLRSMKYGMNYDIMYGSDRDTHEPEIPHHALYDAKAQALDLQYMLVKTKKVNRD